MNDKVLFIGASGFVGTRLIEISKTDFDVTNFDKQQSHFIRILLSPVMFVIRINSIRRLLVLKLSCCSPLSTVMTLAQHRYTMM